MKTKKSPNSAILIAFIIFCFTGITYLISHELQEEYEPITSNDCTGCHEKSKHGTDFVEDLSLSIHEGFECLDCHLDKKTFPHQEVPDFTLECHSCSSCHEDQARTYKIHGRALAAECEDAPTCTDCHGSHNIVPSTDINSMTHPINLPKTCGSCHQDLDLIEKYNILVQQPIQIYESSVHSQATKEGIFAAATCNDCHSTEGTAHKIYSPGHPESTINHFNIPFTCGKCHQEVEKEYWQGIHGELVSRGQTDAPVCTDCHGEHGILPPDDPRSPVSSIRLAEATCAPCHESVRLSEKYGLPLGRLASFIDSYHGLKTKAGDQFVANCASCHGVHKILPRSDPESTIHPDNLQNTCGECHPGISAELAQSPIHGMGGEGLQTKTANLVQNIYIIAIFIIIGLMAIHWIIDLIRQIILIAKRKPQVRRMNANELCQHTLLMLSFIVLVITGFSLRFDQAWITKFLFGWEGGFRLRGIIHRIASVVLIITTIWHIFFLFTERGRRFFYDMRPRFGDFRDFIQKILFNLGLSKKEPRFGRFSYIEKAEYWALIWGVPVMIISGLLLWFDNFFIKIFPKGVLDVSLVIHYYEAILASLAILIWHMYSTVFNPRVYPMNPSWLTGKMPEDMFIHEHQAVGRDEIEIIKEKKSK